MKEDLNKWFKEKWVNIGKKVDGKHPPCGTSGEKSGYAKCVPAAKAAGMSKKEKESATRRKRAAQNDAGRGGSNSKGQGKTPIYVSTKPKNETMSIDEKLNLFLEKNCPTDPEKWSASKSAAKSKFDVYPSAYANGWAAKNYKSKGGGWKACKNEDVVNEEPAKTPSERIQNLNNRIKALRDKMASTKSPKQKNLIQQRLKNALQSLSNIKKDHGIKAPHKEGIVNEACWDGYKQVGMKTKNGKEVPNCVPVNENDNDMKLVNLMPVNAKKVNEQIDEVEEYDVENEQDMKEFVQFMKEYTQYLAEANCNCVYEAEYQGRKVQLGKPMAGDVKKFKVYVRNGEGNVVKVNFGQKGVKIKKNNPDRRKSFRARHNCDNPGPRWKARYWSCRKW